MHKYRKHIQHIFCTATLLTLFVCASLLWSCFWWSSNCVKRALKEREAAPQCQLCFAQRWKDYSSVMQTWHQELPTPPPKPSHTHTHINTDIPLLHASSLFLPTRPLRPQGQLVWHRIPSPPPLLLHLILPSQLLSEAILMYSALYWLYCIITGTYTFSWCQSISCRDLWPLFIPWRTKLVLHSIKLGKAALFSCVVCVCDKLPND